MPACTPCFGYLIYDGGNSAAILAVAQDLSDYQGDYPPTVTILSEAGGVLTLRAHQGGPYGDTDYTINTGDRVVYQPTRGILGQYAILAPVLFAKKWTAL